MKPYQFESGVEDGSSTREIEDLASDDIDTAIVGRVELEDHRVELLRVVDLFGARQDCGRFTRSRWSIEQLKHEIKSSTIN